MVSYCKWITLFRAQLNLSSDSISSRDYNCDVLLGWWRWSIKIINMSLYGSGKNTYSIPPRILFSFPWLPQLTRSRQSRREETYSTWKEVVSPQGDQKLYVWVQTHGQYNLILCPHLLSIQTGPTGQVGGCSSSHPLGHIYTLSCDVHLLI